MDIYKSFATDAALEQSGVWSRIGDGAELLIARAGNKRYAKLLTKQVTQNQRALDAGNEASTDLSESLMIDVMAETILLGWRRTDEKQVVVNNLLFKGAPMEYSVANAKVLLGVKDFRKLVNQLSDDFNAYRVAAEETEKKS